MCMSVFVNMSEVACAHNHRFFRPAPVDKKHYARSCNIVAIGGDSRVGLQSGLSTRATKQGGGRNVTGANRGTEHF